MQVFLEKRVCFLNCIWFLWSVIPVSTLILHGRLLSDQVLKKGKLPTRKMDGV